MLHPAHTGTLSASTFPLRSSFPLRSARRQWCSDMSINKSRTPLDCNPQGGWPPSTVQPWMPAGTFVATAVAVGRSGSVQLGIRDTQPRWKPREIRSTILGQLPITRHITDPRSGGDARVGVTRVTQAGQRRYPRSFAYPPLAAPPYPQEAIHKVAIATLQFTSLHTHARNASWSIFSFVLFAYSR